MMLVIWALVVGVSVGLLPFVFSGVVKTRREALEANRREREDPILNPGVQPAPRRSDAEREFDAAMVEFKAAWLAPNEEFIRETDRILNGIEWERLGDPDVIHATGFTADVIQVGQIAAAPVAPYEPKPTYSFGYHDQGKAVFG